MDKSIIWFETVASTNDALRDLSEKHHGMCLAARAQTSGRGQRGNVWESSPGLNLLASFYLEVDVAVVDSFRISMAAALAVRDVAAWCGVEANVKWPNDIVASGHKIAGLLVENDFMGDRVDSVILGVGLNINQMDFPGLPKASSLGMIMRREYNVVDVCNKLNKCLLERIKNLSAASLRDEYLALLYGRDGALYSSQGVEFRASIVDVADDGCLTLRRDDGDLQSFYFKEVEMIF